MFLYFANTVNSFNIARISELAVKSTVFPSQKSVIMLLYLRVVTACPLSMPDVIPF